MERPDAVSADLEPQVSAVKGARPDPAAVELQDVGRVGPPGRQDASAGGVLPALADRTADAARKPAALELTASPETRELPPSAVEAAALQASPQFAERLAALESPWLATPP
jgi:hypothetical protein